MPRITGQEAKKLLKKHGIDTSKVSIRNSRGSALDVTINCLSVDIDAVRAILEPMERVSRCEVTGEILSGGNYFVFVAYRWDMDFVPEEYVDAYTLALAETDPAIERHTHAFPYWVKRNMAKTLAHSSEGQISGAYYACDRVMRKGN